MSCHHYKKRDQSQAENALGYRGARLVQEAQQRALHDLHAAKRAKLVSHGSIGNRRGLEC